MNLRKIFIFQLCWLTALSALNVVSTVNAQEAASPNKSKVSNKVALGRWEFPEDGVVVEADFPCARLNDCNRLSEGEYEGLIQPENEPINDSPWFAFKVTANERRSLTFRLECQGGQFRYIPKVSTDGEHWIALPSEAFERSNNKKEADLKLEVGPETLWVAAQKIVSQNDLRAWAYSIARLPFVAVSEFGKSTRGQTLVRLDLGNAESHWKISIVGRQHPPETTGSLALMRFVEELASDTEVARQFREKFHVLIMPLLNPDGVDGGHWRHSLGLVDLNRDWMTFAQPETKAVSEQITELQESGRLCLHLDFHSTHKDVFYTQPDDAVTFPENFTAMWLAGLQKRVPEYKVVREAAAAPRLNVSASWAFRTFGVPGITYEIGDNTDRALLRQVASAAANEMMTLMLETMSYEVPGKQP